ncbi:MAG TPA: CxxC-x17-CxxC domain-containing protein [Candidatus Thermoplasmatota archaeon]|nr:CxxC-x17-CxxC domain-containing protein [Candidatus Thermoplasmatota archaeon]
MNSSTPTARSAAPPRVQIEVTCTACNQTATVPFQPTPGRPVFCAACFAKRGPTAFGARGGGSRPRTFGTDLNRSAPKKRMLSQGRKAHFVYDVLEVLTREGQMAEEQRRAFVEMLFTRGSRQSTEAARDFLAEKQGDETVTPVEAARIDRLLEQYSFRR